MQDETGPAKLTWTSPRLRLKVLFTAFLLAFLCYGFFTWVLWPVKVLGDSMMPNYRDGERHFINKLAYHSVKPMRGDVIGLYAPNGDVYIKRVIGLPGETVTFPKDGGIAIDGRELSEPYVKTKIPADRGRSGRLEPDYYFVIGDNRATSVLGAVPARDIIGKVVF